MTRKDFKLLADIVRECSFINEDDRPKFAAFVGHKLMETNDRFSFVQFCHACRKVNENG